MKSHKVLIPVFGSNNSYRKIRALFWPGKEDHTELYISEIIPPPGFFKWLAGPVLKLFKLFGNQNHDEWIRNQAFPCQKYTILSPSLTIGIVEAARRIHPDTIVLPAEWLERIGNGGITELKDHLSEVHPCTLIISLQGLHVRVEPIRMKAAHLSGPADHQWVA